MSFETDNRWRRRRCRQQRYIRRENDRGCDGMNIMLLAAFLVQADPSSAALHEIITDLHLQDSSNAGEAVGHKAA
jgi:hypothetical protein